MPNGFATLASFFILAAQPAVLEEDAVVVAVEPGLAHAQDAAMDVEKPTMLAPLQVHNMCSVDEQTVISGAVQDDFGFDLAVCFSGEGDDRLLTIRWVGEGGGSSVSCKAGECDGAIEYSRYTSPYLTILKLGWKQDNYIQYLTQQMWRFEMGGEVHDRTDHSWQPLAPDPDHAPGQESTYPVVTSAEALALMKLEGFLETKSGNFPLFRGD